MRFGMTLANRGIPPGLGFRASWQTILQPGRAAGRDTERFDNVLCHHININEDADAALADAKRYLDLYYGAN
jgi:hypothetical protein